MPRVTYIINGQETVIDAPEGETILKIALDNGIPMESACGGNGFCTTCLCNVQEGMNNLSPRNDREENMGVTDGPERLGCQAKVQGDVTVEVEEF
jgi:adenylate cyclase